MTDNTTPDTVQLVSAHVRGQSWYELKGVHSGEWIASQNPVENQP